MCRGLEPIPEWIYSEGALKNGVVHQQDEPTFEEEKLVRLKQWNSNKNSRHLSLVGFLQGRHVTYAGRFHIFWFPTEMELLLKSLLDLRLHLSSSGHSWTVCLYSKTVNNSLGGWVGGLLKWRDLISAWGKVLDCNSKTTDSQTIIISIFSILLKIGLENYWKAHKISGFLSWSVQVLCGPQNS